MVQSKKLCIGILLLFFAMFSCDFFVYAYDLENIKNMDDNDFLKNIKQSPESAFEASSKRSLNMINQNLDLMEQANVLIQFENFIKSNINQINHYPLLVEKWFSTYDLAIDQDAKIRSYDGQIIVTEGSGSSMFNINDHPGARVSLEGCLVTIQFNTCEAVISKKENGGFRIKGGSTNLNEIVKIDLEIENGVVTKGDKMFESNSNHPFYVSFSSPDGIRISGEEVRIYEEKEGFFSSFSGSVIINEEDYHRDIIGGTTYTTYVENEATVTFNAKNDLSIHYFSGECETNENCVEHYYEDDRSKIKITVANNIIDLVVNDDSLDLLVVDQIMDNSKINVKKDVGVKLEFSRDPVIIKGDFRKLGLDFENLFKNQHGDTHMLKFFESGEIIYCSDCIVVGRATIRSSSSKDELKQRKLELENEYGVKPFDVIKYLDEPYLPHEREMLLDMLSIADHLEIDRSLFIASAMQEGAILHAIYGYYSGYSSYPEFLDSYGHMGADSLVIDSDRLIKKGYLPLDFKERGFNAYEDINEAGLKIISKSYKIQDLLLGVGALLKDKVDYATDNGNNEIYSQLNENEKAWIGYASYNWGQGNVKKMMTGQVFVQGKNKQKYQFNSVYDLKKFIHKYEGDLLSRSNANLNDLHFNAGRVVSGKIILDEFLLNAYPFEGEPNLASLRDKTGAGEPQMVYF